MPTIRDAAEYYMKALRDGKGDLHTGHCFIAEEEAKKRERGEPDAEGNPKTKIAWDSADPDSYREWHVERKRWMHAAVQNPTLATDMMIVALKAYSEEGMQAIKEAIGETRVQQDGPRPPKAEIPSWPVKGEKNDSQ